MVGHVYQVGAGIVGAALGYHLDGCKHILKPLYNGGDKHVDSSGRAHGNHHVAEDFPQGNIVQPGRLNDLLGYPGHTCQYDDKIIAEHLPGGDYAQYSDDPPLGLGPEGKGQAKVL